MTRVKGLLKNKIVTGALIVLVGFLSGQAFTNNIAFSSNVVGESMSPTYVSDEIVWVNRLGTPERGDVIIVDEGNKYVIKRCVGMPGDTIQIIDGVVYINAEEYPEPYIKDGDHSYYSGVAINPITLADDEYFMLGDNRKISKDSREIGPISRDMIVGVVID